MNEELNENDNNDKLDNIILIDESVINDSFNYDMKEECAIIPNNYDKLNNSPSIKSKINEMSVINNEMSSDDEIKINSIKRNPIRIGIYKNNVKNDS
jgi:hypothetical protein